MHEKIPIYQMIFFVMKIEPLQLRTRGSDVLAEWV